MEQLGAQIPCSGSVLVYRCEFDCTTVIFEGLAVYIGRRRENRESQILHLTSDGHQRNDGT